MNINIGRSLIMVAFATLGLLLSGCESEYSQLVKGELKTGELHTNLLFNLEMGDTKKEFFSKCWDLNKEKKISQGSGGKYAKYLMIPDSMDNELDKVDVLFYGIFDEENIMHGMEMKMSFFSWSPWNEDFHADRLMEYIETRYMRELSGNPFIEIDIKEGTVAKVKIDGNRQIRMFPLNDKDIMVMIEDLRQKYGTTKPKTNEA